MRCRKRLVRHLLLIGLLALPVPICAQQTLSDQALIEALQQGGYNLYFRHEATDWSQHDAVRQGNDWLSCDGNRMRQLSEQGRQRAIRTGHAMRKFKIPVSEVFASPYWRTMETARKLDLGDVKASTEVINLRVAEYFGGRETVVATARTLLARRPADGSNRVIVAHGNVAQAATPVYPGEGEMVIFKPDDEGGFIFIGRIAPERWAQLSQDQGADQVLPEAVADNAVVAGIGDPDPVSTHFDSFRGRKPEIPLKDLAIAELQSE